MTDYPNTIKSPKKFDESMGPWFDGIFDWSFTKNCFARGISPMDLDGIVEMMIRSLTICAH